MKVVFQGLLGIAFGVLLLWMALSGIDGAAISAALAQANIGYLLAGIGLFWIGVLFRILRWQALLTPVRMLTFWQVGLALVIGYAVNIILPARLGELFRADFLRRRFEVARSAALGSIIIERLLDAVVVGGLFAIGLLAAANRQFDPALITVAYGAAAAIVIGCLGVCMIVFFEHRLPFGRFPRLAARVSVMAQTLAIVRGPIVIRCALVTLLVWSAESLAILMMVWAFGVAVSLSGLCLIVGAASLSTMLPSAPGYIGSLQFAFILTYSALKFDAVHGVLSATATQVMLMGSIACVGIGLLLIDNARAPARHLRATFRASHASRVKTPATEVRG